MAHGRQHRHVRHVLGVMSNYVAIYGKEQLEMTNGTGIFFMLLSFGLFASRLQGQKLSAWANLQPIAPKG